MLISVTFVLSSGRLFALPCNYLITTYQNNAISVNTKVPASKRFKYYIVKIGLDRQAYVTVKLI